MKPVVSAAAFKAEQGVRTEQDTILRFAVANLGSLFWAKQNHPLTSLAPTDRPSLDDTRQENNVATRRNSARTAQQLVVARRRLNQTWTTHLCQSPDAMRVAAVQASAGGHAPRNGPTTDETHCQTRASQRWRTKPTAGSVASATAAGASSQPAPSHQLGAGRRRRRRRPSPSTSAAWRSRRQKQRTTSDIYDIPATTRPSIQYGHQDCTKCNHHQVGAHFSNIIVKRLSSIVSL